MVKRTSAVAAYIFCLLNASTSFAALQPISNCAEELFNYPLPYPSPPVEVVSQRSLKVREAETADQWAILNFIAHVRGEHGVQTDFSMAAESIDSDLAQIEQIYDGVSGRFLLVFDNQGTLVATAAFAQLDTTTCELRKVYLDNSIRGLRLGPALVQRLISEARDFGYRRMLLKTHSTMIEAKELYRKLGFHSIANWPYATHSRATEFYETQLR